MTTTPTITIQPLLLTHLHAMWYAHAGAPRAGVLLVPPLFEEKRAAHRTLTACAAELARQGCGVLHLELTGTGNSAGEIRAVLPAHWQEDLHLGAAAVRERVSAPLTVVAFRAGALLAAPMDLQARLLLCQPVTSGKVYLRQLRTRRKIQDSVTGEAPLEIGEFEVEGQELSPESYAALEALTLPDTCPPGVVSLLQCSFNDKVLAEYARLAEGWGLPAVRCLVQAPFWNPHSPGLYADLTAALAEEVLRG